MRCSEIRKAWNANVKLVLAFGTPQLEQLSFGAKPVTVAGVKVLPQYSQQDGSRMESLGGWVGGWARVVGQVGSEPPAAWLFGCWPPDWPCQWNGICAGSSVYSTPAFLLVFPPSCTAAAAAVAAVLLLDLRWAGEPDVVIRLPKLPTAAVAMSYIEASCHLRVELSGFADEASTWQPSPARAAIAAN